MRLFSSPHLLLWWKRPSLLSAAKENSGNNEAVATQTAIRAATQGGGDLIRDMRAFEEPHAFTSHEDSSWTAPHGTFLKSLRLKEPDSSCWDF
jgi:hypothetical protein